MSSRSVATVGLYAALLAALGFLLSGVPNIELMTLGAFLGGGLLGPARGAGAGACGIAIYSSMNPYGMAPPPTFATQVLGFAGIGAAGILLHRDALARTGAARAAAWGAVGCALTLGYDVLTNLGTAWAAALPVVPTMIGGITFGLWHLVANTVLFAGAGPPLHAALLRRRQGRL